MSKRRLAGIVLIAVASTVLAGMPSHADGLPVGGGCYVPGDVDGYPQYVECTYTARTTTQTMYIGSPNLWRAFVKRSVFQPNGCYDPSTRTFYDCWVDQDFELGGGYGPLLDAGGQPRAPGLIQIHPEVGETVHVWMMGDCYPDAPTTCGKQGLIGTYE